MLYNNNKNHRDRRNYKEWSVGPVFGLFLKAKVYGTFGAITSIKEAVKCLGRKSFKEGMKLRERTQQKSLVSLETLGGCVKVSPLSWPAICVSISILSHGTVTFTMEQTNLLTTALPPYFLRQWLAPVTQFQSVVYLCQCHPKVVPRRTNLPQRKAQVVHPSSLISLVDVGPQGLVKSLEGGSVGYVATPTAHHQLEERGRAEWRSIEEDLEELKRYWTLETQWINKLKIHK